MARAKTLSVIRPAAAFGHPLDPLSEAEVAAACAILKTGKKLGPDTRFIHVQLDEPAKADILCWKPGAQQRRRVSSTLFDCKTGATNTAVVDIDAKTIVSWNEHSTKTHPTVSRRSRSRRCSRLATSSKPTPAGAAP